MRWHTGTSIKDYLFEKPPDVLRVFLFKTRKIWEVLLTGEIIELKLTVVK